MYENVWGVLPSNVRFQASFVKIQFIKLKLVEINGISTVLQHIGRVRKFCLLLL